MDRVDILTGTLGKALGGASGGYVSAPPEIVDLLRQRSRPYLFSNSVAPTVPPGRSPRSSWPPAPTTPARSCAPTPTLFRSLMTEAGFDLLPG